MSEDEDFITDHHPRYSQVVIATGFWGHGCNFTPVIGSTLADLAIEAIQIIP